MIDYIKILPFSIELNNVRYGKRVEVNFVFIFQHSKPSLQISMPLVGMVQRRWVVTTQVKIMTDKLHCPAVFNGGMCRTLVTTE